MSKILVIAPHPDDEVLGCGGTIKKYVESGDEVYLCIITKPRVPDWSEEYIASKQKEIEASNKALGFKETFFLDLPALRLDTIAQKDLNDQLIKICEKLKPQILYIPFFGDINHDHQIVSRAGLVAARPKPGSLVKKIFAYEVLSETEWNMPRDSVFVPNYYEDISGFVDAKKEAMACYKSELKEYPHPRSLEGIEILAKKRGIEAGLEYAEAFMLIREINK
ncbi:MAG: PIG-L deacetylase family protein [Patescibacteria group bacterium]